MGLVKLGEAMSETMIIRTFVVLSGLVLAGVLIAAWLYGLDLSSIFLGTPWNSTLPHNRVAIALEGVIVGIALPFGGLFFAGVMALIRKI